MLDRSKYLGGIRMHLILLTLIIIVNRMKEEISSSVLREGSERELSCFLA